ATFSFALDRARLRRVRQREGRYLLRTNLCGKDPAELWRVYIQLVEVEAAFKTMKDDLQLRPIYHQLEQRIEAHIFVAFLAYCLHVTLRARLKPLAPGLTPRARAAQSPSLRASPHGRCSTSSPLCKCSTCTFRRPTAARSSSAATPNSPPNKNSSSSNSNSFCRRSPRHVSPRQAKPFALKSTMCSGDFHHPHVD